MYILWYYFYLMMVLCEMAYRLSEMSMLDVYIPCAGVTRVRDQGRTTVRCIAGDELVSLRLWYIDSSDFYLLYLHMSYSRVEVILACTERMVWVYLGIVVSFALSVFDLISTVCCGGYLFEVDFMSNALYSMYLHNVSFWCHAAAALSLTVMVCSTWCLFVPLCWAR